MVIRLRICSRAEEKGVSGAKAEKAVTEGVAGLNRNPPRLYSQGDQQQWNSSGFHGDDSSLMKRAALLRPA